MQSDSHSIRICKRQAIGPMIMRGDGRHDGQRTPRSNSKSTKVGSPSQSDAGGERGVRSMNVDGFRVVNDVAFTGRQAGKQHSEELEDYEISDSSILSGEWLW